MLGGTGKVKLGCQQDKLIAGGDLAWANTSLEETWLGEDYEQCLVLQGGKQKVEGLSLDAV